MYLRVLCGTASFVLCQDFFSCFFKLVPVGPDRDISFSIVSSLPHKYGNLDSAYYATQHCRSRNGQIQRTSVYSKPSQKHELHVSVSKTNMEKSWRRHPMSSSDLHNHVHTSIHVCTHILIRVISIYTPHLHQTQACTHIHTYMLSSCI